MQIKLINKLLTIKKKQYIKLIFDKNKNKKHWM